MEVAAQVHNATRLRSHSRDVTAPSTESLQLAASSSPSNLPRSHLPCPSFHVKHATPALFTLPLASLLHAAERGRGRAAMNDRLAHAAERVALRWLPAGGFARGTSPAGERAARRVSERRTCKCRKGRCAPPLHNTTRKQNTKDACSPAQAHKHVHKTKASPNNTLDGQPARIRHRDGVQLRGQEVARWIAECMRALVMQVQDARARLRPGRRGRSCS